MVLAAGRAAAACLLGAGPVLAGPDPAGRQGGDRRSRAWALARYAVGQPDPYFAPLAALLGVYPTVARSLREGVQYVAGFLLGAALAIPVGMLPGPGIAGIAVVVIAGCWSAAGTGWGIKVPR